MKTLFYFALLILIFGTMSSFCLFSQNELPETLPSHPRIVFKKTDINQIKKRIARNKWANDKFNNLQILADSWLNRKVALPDRGGQWYHYYSCPEHGARLRTESSTRHVCPVDGNVFSGYPYDDVVIMSEHNGFAKCVEDARHSISIHGK